jgi:hypothetical protein
LKSLRDFSSSRRYWGIPILVGKQPEIATEYCVINLIAYSRGVQTAQQRALGYFEDLVT